MDEDEAKTNPSVPDGSGSESAPPDPPKDSHIKDGVESRSLGKLVREVSLADTFSGATLIATVMFGLLTAVIAYASSTDLRHRVHDWELGPVCSCYEHLSWKFLRTPADAARVMPSMRQAAVSGESRNWEQAARVLESVMRDGEPVIPGLRQNLAVAYLEQEQVHKAEEYLAQENRVLDCLDRRSDDSLEQLILLDPATHPAPKAAELREMLLRARAALKYNFACVYAHLARTQEAMKQLKAALDLGFNDLGQIDRDRFLVRLRSQQAYDDLLAPLRRQQAQ